MGPSNRNDPLDDTATAEPGPRIAVLAPSPQLVVEIVDEPEREGNEGHPTIHLHPGGQGAWVASMAVALGADVVLSAPLGGELGEPLRRLLIAAGITVKDGGDGPGTGASVVDLRGEDRVTIANMPSPPLGRHEVDDYYGVALVDALESDAAIVTGVDPPELLSPEFFGRLVADVRAANIPVVADVAADVALAVIREGPTVLKISHEETLAVGLAKDDALGTLRTTAEKLVADGVGAVVISRAEKPALLVTSDGARLFAAPSVSTVMHRGAGDSMTAGIAVGIARGMSIEDALRLGAAAGALNVARHGLGSGRREQIERFAEQIEVSDANVDGSA